METILTNNQMSQEEFKLFCMNHQMQKEQKEIDFTDFICFILETAIHSEEDMGFTKAEAYKDGSCFDEDNEELELIKYATGEEAWDKLFELIGVQNYEEFEERFESCYIASWGMHTQASGTNSGIMTNYNGVAGNFASSGRTIFLCSSSSAWQSAFIYSYDIDGFTLAWAPTGTPPSGTIELNYIAFK